MLRWLTSPNVKQATALQLYGSSVAQARQPAFYRAFGVADSIDGRFELVMLHVGLVLRRLAEAGAEGKDLGQHLVERMFGALDDDLREIGIGDLSVPKRMTSAASAFYGRLRVYDAALGAGDAEGLAAALARNLPATEGVVLDGAGLATYALLAAERLSDQPMAQLQRGVVSFPEPGANPP
jgi:cytochrome b pre-mRNA-processing protein 3